MNEGAKVSGAMNRILKVESLHINVKRMMCERLVVPTVLYGAETWGLNAMEMKYLRRMCGVAITNRIRNGEIRRRVGGFEGSVGFRWRRAC